MSTPIRDSKGRFISPSAAVFRARAEALAMEVQAAKPKKPGLLASLARIIGFGGGDNAAHQKA